MIIRQGGKFILNRNFVFTILFGLILILSVSAIQAQDINSTSVGTIYDDNISVEDASDFVETELNDQNVLTDDLSNSSQDEESKNTTDLTSQSSQVYYHGDYKVVLKDSNSSVALSNKTIILTINNVNYTSATDNNGVASVNLKLNPGKYKVTAYFEGDLEYGSCNFISSFSILPVVKASDITKYYNGAAKYTATFYDSQGNPLSYRKVAVSVNGKSYTKQTNAKGVVSLAVNLKPGTYKIVSTDPITGYKLTSSFKILSTISASNLNKVEGDSKKFSVKFLKSNGNPLSKKYVKIKFKGKTKKYKTTSKGIVNLNVKKLKKGTYKVICYNKDGLSKTYKIKVFKRKASTKLTTHSYVFYTNQSKQIKVKLSTDLGDGSNSGKLIKININGVTYSRGTDANGVVYLQLPSLDKGLYKVQYTYGGNKFFKKSTSTNYVTVLSKKNTKLAPVGITSFGYGAGTSLKVKYTSSGVPLVKKDITLKVNGKTYTKTTDYGGFAYLPINMNIGNYSVDYKTDNDSYVWGTSGSFDIDVFKRSDSKLTWKSGISFKDNKQTFKILLTDSKGKPISSQTVKLTIDGETYSAKTSSSGYATFKTSVALGNYNVSFKFDGNNNYLSSMSSKSVKVTLSLFKNGINQKNSISYLKAYLKSSSHCKVGNKKIKKLVKSLTKGLTANEDKARVIFNYVRDTLAYSYYYDTKYGAVTTLKLKKGNCVDHSHLLVSMFRTAGLKARYVHGVCKFSDGDVTGHVWTQVLIGKNWVCADATSYKNSLGKIGNWNTKSYKINAKYASLPF